MIRRIFGCSNNGFLSLTQLLGTMHNICKVGDSNVETTKSSSNIDNLISKFVGFGSIREKNLIIF